MFSLADISPAGILKRRVIFALIVATWLALGAIPMWTLLADGGWSAVKIGLFAAFLLLLFQVAFGFTVAAIGYWQLRKGGDPFQINRTLPPEILSGNLPATAIVMPIFNEEVGRVFQGLKVMFDSLQKTGRAEAFDFFVLSDTNDANHWVAEEKAWIELCKQVNGFGRIFYRKRRIALHHKSGNVADFCRRWGAKYRYMIVLDADSIMTGKAFVRLVGLMETNPGVGIIQTNPKNVLGQTLYQRMMQFLGAVYRPIFSAGANFWQAGQGSYWGHNAIIRLGPFMEFCAMPELPQGNSLGTRVLSHDTIEAALMLRAGYSVWLADDLEGSYEEGPPHLLAALQRDHRWCFGNLQHLWFLFARGIKAASRLHIFNGIMSYASSPLWLLFLVLSAWSLVSGTQPEPPAVAPWISRTILTRVLFGYVMTLLLLPKALAVDHLFRSKEKLQQCGGRARVLLSALGETVFSILQAPILMLFYTRFVVASLLGSSVQWNCQDRNATDDLPWKDLAAVHLMQTLGALACATLVGWLFPALFPGLLLLCAGPALSIPFSRILSSRHWGEWTRKRRWFLTPEETIPPAELLEVQQPFVVPAAPFFRAREYADDYGLLQAILDPYVNALHVSLLRQRPQVSLRTRQSLDRSSEKLLQQGPIALTAREKRLLLWDADSMLHLHRRLWSSPGPQLHQWWQAAFRRYNESNALSVRRTVGAL